MPEEQIQLVFSIDHDLQEHIASLGLQAPLQIYNMKLYLRKCLIA